MFTSMQKVLTLQFSAAMELTNDNGLERLNRSQMIFWPKDGSTIIKLAKVGLLEQWRDVPHSLRQLCTFLIVQLLAKPSLSPSSLLYFENFFFAALQVKAYSRI